MTRTLVAPVARLLSYAARFFARTARVFNHLAAGTSTIDDLRAGIECTWGDFNARDADIAAGLTEWEQEVVARFLSPDGQVLLVGSGTGRDLVALAARGYQVTGVEPARRAVAICRRQLAMRGLTAELIEGFFEDIALPRRFDTIVFAVCCYGMIPESRRRIAALRKAAAHLTPRGRILINYMTDAPSHPALIRLTRFAATVSGSDWRPENGDVMIAMSSNQSLFTYEHRFGSGEFEAEASAAGLRASDRFDIPRAPLVVLEAIATRSTDVQHAPGATSG
jgi:SAM-dependent methyltransferase